VTSPAQSYRVFARKYRPRSFAEVIGQDHIVRALSAAIDKQRVGQAYMLIGPRGVGKTTTARIIAKSMNCLNGPTVTPCLECHPCVEIERGSDMDVIEIDGASNNGVDDVRGIRDAVQTHPMRDRRKIYIIDEVQRLSGQAFDALLKTLEEPPAHAMFLFATTDPHKIPETIVSRCQIFEFRRIREVDVQIKLQFVCDQEGVAVPSEVLAAIARGCRGGMRDAESMLDQLLATSDDEVTLDDLESLSGLARPERWLRLFEAIANDDPKVILLEIASFLEVGGTERDFVEQSVDALRDLLHVALLGEDSIGVEPAPERKQQMVELARTLGRDRMEGIMGMIFSLESRIQRSPLGARALLEYTMLRAARINQFFELANLLNNDGTVQAAVTTPPTSRIAVAAPQPTPTPKAVPKPEAAVPKNAVPAPAAPPKLTFNEMMAQLTKERPTLAATIKSYFISAEKTATEIALILRQANGADLSVLEDPVEQRALRELSFSPLPWRIEFEVPPIIPVNPTVESLVSEFDGPQEIE
jgi:DNA polymerase-3 subunit gamma/tau